MATASTRVAALLTRTCNLTSQFAKIVRAGIPKSGTSISVRSSVRRGTAMGKKRRLSFVRRALGHEALESRSMLAGMVGDSPFQNLCDENDLNDDGSVSAVDALVAINAINGGVTGRLDEHFAPPSLHGRVKEAIRDFLDADGDGNLSANDALKIINALNGGHRGDGWGNLPTEDQHPDSIEDVTEDTPDLLAERSFAKVRAVLNEKEGGDVDVFKVTPSKDQLNVTLFSRGGGVMSVEVVDPDAEEPLGTIESTEGEHKPARLNVEVETGKTYFIVVKGAEGVSGPYGLSVFNFTHDDFTPQTDSPLGDDIHDVASPTQLQLERGHARVVSNIDEAGDADAFEVAVKDGKLVVEAGADFPLTVDITNAAGDEIGSITTPDGHVIVANVTAAAGPYVVTVAATNGTDTGAYRLNVVNVPIKERPDHPHRPGHELPSSEEIFERLDTGADGSISLAEFKEGVPLGKTRIADRVFAAWDTDNDDKLSIEELVAGLEHLPPFTPHVPGAEAVARPITRH